MLVARELELTRTRHFGRHSQCFCLVLFVVALQFFAKYSLGPTTKGLPSVVMLLELCRCFFLNALKLPWHLRPCFSSSEGAL